MSEQQLSLVQFIQVLHVLAFDRLPCAPNIKQRSYNRGISLHCLFSHETSDYLCLQNFNKLEYIYCMQ